MHELSTPHSAHSVRCPPNTNSAEVFAAPHRSKDILVHYTGQLPASMRCNLSGAGPPRHGLSSKKMALITSDYGILCSLSIYWP